MEKLSEIKLPLANNFRNKLAGRPPHVSTKNEFRIFTNFLINQIVSKKKPNKKYKLGFLAEISFTPLSYHPGGCLGCPEKQISSRNYNLFVRSTVFQPKLNKILKTYKNHQNPFQKLLLFGILSEFIQYWLENSNPNP